MKRIALFGGVYNNFLGLRAVLEDARERAISGEDLYCLGDIGGFGPHPDRAIELLRENSINIVQGNYDYSIGNNLEDCQCGYTDPRDNYFAQISYEYTLEKTSDDHKNFLRNLPSSLRLELGGLTILLCHGSPRFTNEFLWESTSPTYFLEKLCDDYRADVICVTHTGIKWKRALSNNRCFVNVGVIGRPENDGTTNVWYTVMELDKGLAKIEFVPVSYDYKLLADEMTREKIPNEFIETTLTGFWTTCLEVLPARERLMGKF